MPALIRPTLSPKLRRPTARPPSTTLNGRPKSSAGAVQCQRDFLYAREVEPAQECTLICEEDLSMTIIDNQQACSTLEPLKPDEGRDDLVFAHESEHCNHVALLDVYLAPDLHSTDLWLDADRQRDALVAVALQQRLRRPVEVARSGDDDQLRYFLTLLLGHSISLQP